MPKLMKKRENSHRGSVVPQSVGLVGVAAGHSFCGYDAVLWVNARTHAAEPLGGGRAASFVSLYKKDPLHKQAVQETCKRGVYHYEWSRKEADAVTWFQTTCILLSPSCGKDAGVLCLSRDISRLGQKYAADRLKEWTSPKTFSQMLLAARETEKKAISKALHDEVGASSVILTALLSLVKVNVKKGDIKRALHDIEQLDQQIKQGIERFRSIIVSLRPPMLDNSGGLCGAIGELLEKISALSHLPYEFHCTPEGSDINLTENVRILLFRIVQEALTNIVKHARAKQVTVTLRRVGANMRLQISDDGIGFDPKQSVSIAHVGLLAMKDSVELLGGKITIKSAPGKGTRIEVICPSVVYGGENK